MKIIFISLLTLITNLTIAQTQLKFNSNEEFKILQFTDLHIAIESENTTKTLHTIKQVTLKEKPQLIVLTGDIVTDAPALKAWYSLGAFLDKLSIPWTITFGNHDTEHNINKQDIFELLQKFSFFIGTKGEVSGLLNFDIPIYSYRTSKPAASLFFLDSHDYTSNPLLGSYDWIKRDQINHYVERSAHYNEINKGKVLPAVMFIHIPLLEYNHVANDTLRIGDKFEGVASSEINSGLFSALVSSKNVIGVFAGHDHDNNYIGIYKNIALGFGNVTGADAYGQLDRGGRVIVLRANQFSFKSYISTPTQTKFMFHYPSGLTDIKDVDHIFPSLKNIHNLKKGLRYTYYEGNIKKLSEIIKLSPFKKGISETISLEQAEADDHYALEFEGLFYASSTNFYKFYTYSDDGSAIYIDNQLVVDNDGSHSLRRKEGLIALEKGYHSIKVQYFEDYMGQKLEVGMSNIEQPEAKIDAHFLFHN